MVLPEKFKESMKMLLPGEYEDLIGSFEKRPYSGLKVNTKKIRSASALRFGKDANHSPRRKCRRGRSCTPK